VGRAPTAECHRDDVPIRCRQGEQLQVLLEPKKGTQGREMNRKIRIAPALALIVGLLVFAAAASASASPLLSGYGGPGAGEQALIGSTLLAGPRGGAGSGGSSGSSGSGGGGSGASGVSISGGGASGGAGGLRAGSTIGSTTTHGGNGGSSSHPGTAAATGSQASGRSGSSPPLYSRAQLSATAGSSMFPTSSGALMLLAGIVAALALLGTLTVRLSRLQP
jgi:hypothetical protein